MNIDNAPIRHIKPIVQVMMRSKVSSKLRWRLRLRLVIGISFQEVSREAQRADG